MGNTVDGPKWEDWECRCGRSTAEWQQWTGGNRKVDIFIGPKNLGSLAARAGNRESSMLNLRDSLSPSCVFLVLHHGFSFTCFFSDPGVAEGVVTM